MNKNMTTIGTSKGENNEILVCVSTSFGSFCMGTQYAKYFVNLLLLTIEQAEKMNGESHD